MKRLVHTFFRLFELRYSPRVAVLEVVFDLERLSHRLFEITESIKLVSGVHLQLVDAKGRVAAETTSAYDGFYLFNRVIPGRYHLRLAPEQRNLLGLAPLSTEKLTIGPEGTVLSGLDIWLESRSR